MPKDEFDLDDPLELNGVGIACEEDTTGAMTDCFIEEFMRLGHTPRQILAMFRNPHYLGMNMALQHRGEQFIRDAIATVFAQWGRAVDWENDGGSTGSTRDTGAPIQTAPAVINHLERPEERPAVTDPLGAPIPDLSK